jgi:hypothetical protein
VSVSEKTALTSASLTDAMNLALEYLRDSFRPLDENRGGWYHKLDDKRPGVTASAVGLYVFRLAGVRFERTGDVLRYLVSEQISLPNDPGGVNGGWAVRTTEGFPIVECTAWVVRVLSVAGTSIEGIQGALVRGAAWLERNQNTDYGWGSYGGRPSRVFTTALALMALQECGGSPEVISNGLRWLRSAQSPEEPA